MVDLDQHPEEADAHNIDEMPVVIAFNGDKEESKWTATCGSVLSWVKFLET